MKRLIERCAGLDVHKASVTACVHAPDANGERVEEICTFKTTTAGLLTLRDWLASRGVTVVAMEATGVYWKPVVRHEALFHRVEWKAPPVACRSRRLEAEGSLGSEVRAGVGAALTK